MAQIVKRKNKNGSASYLFRVSTGYDRNGKQVTTSRTFTPPPTLTGRKLERKCAAGQMSLNGKCITVWLSMQI